mmetsp:Transcript_82197/g.166563  ORF Transcript_82197/g.166563 Transcript_82197/m.166563 type:complete len:83 (-) Transcript_82197:120-368(-)
MYPTKVFQIFRDNHRKMWRSDTEICSRSFFTAIYFLGHPTADIMPTQASLPHHRLKHGTGVISCTSSLWKEMFDTNNFNCTM